MCAPCIAHNLPALQGCCVDYTWERKAGRNARPQGGQYQGQLIQPRAPGLPVSPPPGQGNLCVDSDMSWQHQGRSRLSCCLALSYTHLYRPGEHMDHLLATCPSKRGKSA